MTCGLAQNLVMAIITKSNSRRPQTNRGSTHERSAHFHRNVGAEFVLTRLKVDMSRSVSFRIQMLYKVSNQQQETLD